MTERLAEVWIHTPIVMDSYHVYDRVTRKWTEALCHSQGEYDSETYYLHRVVIKMISTNSIPTSIRVVCISDGQKSSILLERWYSAQYAPNERFIFPSFPHIHLDLVSNFSYVHHNVAITFVKDDV